MSRFVRILAVVFLAVFAAGTAAHAAAATGMSLKMSVSGMDDGGMADCKCPGDDAQASSCEQFCVVTLAALCTHAGANLPIAAEVVTLGTAGRPGGRGPPPDPHPPRTILS